MNDILIPVILAGGVGSRLWPVSRDLHPKPFIRMQDGESLLQKVYRRSVNLPSVSQTVTVTNAELLSKVEREFHSITTLNTANAFVLEPFPRNTAPAIAAAALLIQDLYGSDAILLVLAADHLISGTAAFETAVKEAIALAKNDRLVTFGITPTYPETGYGYIEADGTDVLRFVEKPSHETAEAYLDSGKFFWNSGIFCFQVRTLLHQMQNHCPEILIPTEECVAQSRGSFRHGDSVFELDANTFFDVPSDSIDYALMEKSDCVSMVSCDMGWSDVGTWSALGALEQSDSNGNQIQGDVVQYNTHNCVIYGPERLTTTVGVSDLIIINTSDALLVANKACAQDVKQIYAELKRRDHDACKVHAQVYRPWGSYTVLEQGVGYKIKRIEVNPGASLSLQSHQHRSEHWVVVSGIANVVNGAQSIMIKQNESSYIPAGQKHRLYNPGLVPCVMIEVQCGPYLGEDDIVRFDDEYGRS